MSFANTAVLFQNKFILEVLLLSFKQQVNICLNALSVTKSLTIKLILLYISIIVY